MRIISVAFLCFSLCLWGEETELALPQRTTKVLSVPAGEVVKGSYVRVGDAHWIVGTIEGDAYLLGSQIVVDGTITGDLIAIGGSVIVNGRVFGNVRILAGEGILQGVVGGIATVIAGATQIGATIGKGLVAIAGNVKFFGKVQENVRAFAGQVEVTSTARILGNLEYRSYHVASISPQSEIGGRVVYTPSFLKDIKNLPGVRAVLIGSQILTFLMNFFYTMVIGIILLRFYPHKVKRTLTTLQKYPWGSLLMGVSVVAILPILAMILLITVIGAPFALTLIALNVISFYTVKVFPILLVSNLFFHRMHWKQNTIWGLVTGQFAYYLLTLIPFLGWLISCLAMLAGLGATIKAQMRKKRV